MAKFKMDKVRSNILIVDDVPANLTLLANMLKEKGYRVRPVPSGKLALKAMESEYPDLILLDISMPEMDGFEVCQRLKEDVRYRNIPIIFISALNEALDKVKAFKCGGVDYITKPFQFEEVEARVKTHLDLHRYQVHLGELVEEQVVANASLAGEIASRKQAEIELRAAKLEAEEATRVKSEFLSTVSHELRTPLTSILGFAIIIKNKFEEVVLPAVEISDGRMEKTMRQIRGNLEIIISEGERLTELINTVLDITKLESGKIDWNMQPLSIESIVERASAATSSLFERKNLRLIKDIEKDLPDVTADRDWLTQVVINLISNAWKFTEQGDIMVKAKAVEEAGTGRKMLEVSVSDQGIGIPADQHERIFEKFSQVGDALTDKPKGTGLGLSICKHVIESHGGRIWAESAPGQGSSFVFTLPLG